MILTNIDNIPGKKIVSHYGIVSGSTVMTKNIIRDIGAKIRNVFGGEIVSYTQLLVHAREKATERMVIQAAKSGSNAIINIRFATSSVTSQAAEIFVYGTAVKVE